MSNTDSDPDASCRATVGLDGAWEFVTDPNDIGVDENWYETDSSWPDWKREVDLPKVWQELEDYHGYTGTAWYRRTVSMPEGALEDGRVFLQFDAVDYETAAWVNGEHVGDNTGGFLPFEFEVTDALKPGENTVCVSVTDPESLLEIPHGKQGPPWYTRISGIWQSVRLEFRPSIHVDDVKVTPDIDTDSAKVVITTNSSNKCLSDTDIEVNCLRDGETVATTRTSATDGVEVVLDFDDPAYWSPESPVLYDLEVCLRRNGVVADRYEDYFGMRSFGTEDGAFLLNGEPVLIQGVLDQGYYPRTLYRPPDDETFEHEVETAKELGFNLIRKHVKPAHPEFLECADRLGMLVWEEPAHAEQYTDRSKSETIDQVNGLIDRDYNRPSVVIWGLYNEEWGLGHHDTEESLWTDEDKQQFLATLYRRTRERDPTRAICDNSGWAHVATDVNDYHDYFVSPDRSAAWEDDLAHISTFPGDNYATTEFDSTDAPVVISEFGTWGFPDVEALDDHYDGNPRWFDHEFLTPEFKRPDGFDTRFEATDLPGEVSLEALGSAWQRRQFVSLEHLVGQMRRRDEIAGYVLTQFTDVEWEFNGVLDSLRRKKERHGKLARVNEAVTVVAVPETRTVWSNTVTDVTITIVNDSDETVFGVAEWWFTAGGAGDSLSTSVPAHTVTEFETTLPVGAGTSAAVTHGDLTVSFETEDRTVTTSERLTVVDRDTLCDSEAVVFAEGAFASRLAATDVSVTHTFDESVDVAFTSRVTSELEQFASDGGAVVQFPTRNGEMVDSGPFSYHRVPQRESWVGTASFFYQRSPLLEDLCTDVRLGWEFAGLYPTAVVTDLDRERDRIHVGYLEGWIENWGSPFLVRDHGRGLLASVTFPVRESYGTDPVATLLCHRLIRMLAGQGTG